METVVENMRLKLNYYFIEAADSRTFDWWLMSNPGPLVAILISYYYFCTWLGPLLMKHRKPFQLKYMLIAYNAFQVLLSTYILYMAMVYFYNRDYNFFCILPDLSDRPSAIWIAEATWWYFFAKITELSDTVFFVLRKKEKQISGLHMYHHTVMPIVAWIGVKYLSGSHGSLIGVLNSFVHIIMYMYYLIAILGPQYQRYLWWKKYLTLLQLIQFVVIALHNIYPLFTNCAYPKICNILSLLNGFIFIYMFGKFYYNSYVKKNKNLAQKTSLSEATMEKNE